MKRKILSGDEAVAYGALAAGVCLGSGYPGTPSTEILETLAAIGGRAEWCPNEKVALEVGGGVSFGGGRSLVTMKHVGLNVAADPLFTLTYMGVRGGLVLVSADDPGLASSQNEQDNRWYAKFAQMPMLEPSNSQEAYDFTVRAFALSEKFGAPVLLRLTTRVCHSQGIVEFPELKKDEPPPHLEYEKDARTKVMVPANAKRAHVRLVNTMKELAVYNEKSDFNRMESGEGKIGIVTSGVAYEYVKDAVPDMPVLKLGFTWPLPMKTIKSFAKQFEKLVVVEEGTRFLEEHLLQKGFRVIPKDEEFEFDELDVQRVRNLLLGESVSMESSAVARPPALCPGCPHRKTFEVLRDEGCIVAGDIGCYTLGVLPPFSAMDVSMCMGASIGMGIGLRNSLPESQARKVVSVIGDGTFLHTGVNGIIEMAYNKPETGHVVLILDNATTAMTGLQEHAGTGRKLDLSPANKLSIEAICRACGADHVDVVDPVAEHDMFVELLRTRLASDDASVILVRRPCLLQVKKLAKIAKKQEAR